MSIFRVTLLNTGSYRLVIVMLADKSDTRFDAYESKSE
jgi:hypothetical protein